MPTQSRVEARNKMKSCCLKQAEAPTDDTGTESEKSLVDVRQPVMMHS